MEFPRSSSCHPPGEAPGFGRSGGASPCPAETAPEDIKESIQDSVSRCLPPHLPLLLRKGQTTFQTLQPTMGAALPRASFGSSRIFCSHGRARALQPFAWLGFHDKLLGLPLRSYHLAPVGFCALLHPPGRTVPERSPSRWQLASWGWADGAPSVCLSPGSLERGFTQHVPRGPLQGRTPVWSHWAASLGSPQCFGVTPQQGEEPGRQIPSVRGADPLGRPAVDVEFGTRCRHCRPASRCSTQAWEGQPGPLPDSQGRTETPSGPPL